MMWARSFGLCLCLSCLWSASSEPLDLPPFDTGKMYEVPGALLEELRLEYLALKMESERLKELSATLETQVKSLTQALTDLEKSYDGYSRAVEKIIDRDKTDILVWKVLAMAGAGSTIGIGIAYFLK